jgi:hypothetical protein
VWLGDGSSGLDQSPPANCAPVDPMDDGQPCGTGCPAGQRPVAAIDGACHCFHACDPAQPTACPCARRCATLNNADGGLAGGACVLANGPGQRCGLDPTGKPYGNGGCAQGTECVNEDAAGRYRYCAYDCSRASDCPMYTACLALSSSGAPLGMACALDSSDNGTRNIGDACSAVDVCKPGALCDGTCKPQCDGPSASCPSGTCTALVDGTRTVGYLCK